MGNVRPLGEPVEGERPDAGRGSELLAQPIDRGPPGPGTAAQPMHVAAADELDVGTRLVQQRCGFAGALTASEHRDAAAAEGAEITVLAGVARKLRGDIGKGIRPKRLAAKSGRDYDPARMDACAIHGLDAETVTGGFEPRDHPRIYLGDGGALEPHSVIDESLERERLAPHEAARGGEGVEGELAMRIGDVRCTPRRSQLHALRHVVPPERHRFAEHPGRDTPFDEMSRGRQTIGAGADDDHLAVVAAGRPIAHQKPRTGREKSRRPR
jgi:hypothetical protein